MRLLLILLVLASAIARPKKKEPEEAEDRVAIAALLVRDGEWDRAAEVLAEVDPKQEGVDLLKYWTLLGLTQLRSQKPAEAAASFEHALALAVEGRELLELHLARARLATGEPALAIEALDRTGEVGASLPGTWLLRAEAYETQGNFDAAWDALAAGAARFPDQPEMQRQQVFMLVRLGLYREARERGVELLARADSDAVDAIAISEALRQGGEHDEAMALLDAAIFEEGESRDLLVQAARTSLGADMPRTAGRFLERAMMLDSRLALEAADAYRRAGDLDGALRANGEVADPVAKARQRLGLLLEAEAWDRALALEERLVRLQLTDDDGVAYGLAYAAFRLGDHTRAEHWLSGISDPEAFRRATELREVMAQCDPVFGCT
jgi:tetratricopeptide (TPR) repeat protein